jgi:hypothetical protein
VSAVDNTEWRQVPVGPGAERWITRAGCKTVLVVVHTVTMGQRLEKLLPLIETDERVQVVFTAAPHAFGNGVASFLRQLDGISIPWEQATDMAFDLAVAAGYPKVHELHAPLIMVPHGAGYNKLVARGGTGQAVAARGVYGLDHQHLVQSARVLPRALVLSHRADLPVLGSQCPEALPVARVVGDPCYDQLAVSTPLRGAYRGALGVTDAARLVVTASTWGTGSLFGQLTELHDRLLDELSSGQHRVVALMHPNVWYGHGPRQVRAWLSGAMRRGLVLVPPDTEWLSALMAADVVIGDAGSGSVYASAAGVPVIMGTFPDEDVARGSAAALLAAAAPRLRLDQPIERQLAEATAGRSGQLSRSVAARLTSEPGQFGRNMRRLIYQVLELAQPLSTPVTLPARMPRVIRRQPVPIQKGA